VNGRIAEWKRSKVTRSAPKALKPWRNKIMRDRNLSIEEKRLRKFSKFESPKFEESAQREDIGFIYLRKLISREAVTVIL
jgi:hypothetical protein